MLLFTTVFRLKTAAGLLYQRAKMRLEAPDCREQHNKFRSCEGQISFLA